MPVQGRDLLLIGISLEMMKKSDLGIAGRVSQNSTFTLISGSLLTLE